MDESIRRQIDEEIKRIRQLEKASFKERLYIKYRSFCTMVTIICPFLFPAIIGGGLCMALIFLGGFLLSTEYHRLLSWICFGVSFIVVWPWVRRNIKFVEIVEDYIREQEGKNGD